MYDFWSDEVPLSFLHRKLYFLAKWKRVCLDSLDIHAFRQQTILIAGYLLFTLFILQHFEVDFGKLKV